MSARQRKKRQSRRQEHSAGAATVRRLVAAGGLTAGATLAMSGVAQAAPMTFYVGTSADPGGAATDCTTPTNTDCSLRRAIDVANTNADTGDTILFNSSLSGSTINLDSGSGDLPTITTGLTIQGPGAGLLTIDAGGNSRIFDINLTTAYQPASISGLTVTNGYSASDGGAIWDYNADLTISGAMVKDSTSVGSGHEGGGVYAYSGSLTINSSTVSGNAAYAGGGIASKYGAVMITDSTVSGNTAYGGGSPGYGQAYGGGIWIYGADLTVDRSTIDENIARDGGGIYMTEVSSGGAIVVKNSTIANNHAAHDDGGGIWSNGSDNTLTVIGSTVTGNTALTHGGGIEAHNSTAPILENSIVSGNTANPASSDDFETYGGSNFDASFSLIGVHSTFVNQTVPGSVLVGVNPQLGSLANNGGATQTELPASTSPVVNKGKSFVLSTDQRGLTRPVAFPGVANSTAAGADGADIGAVELQPPPTPTPTHKTKCKKHKKKHKRSAQSAKKKKCKKKHKKKH
jgi:parallel beta-helix repeat protein